MQGHCLLVPWSAALLDFVASWASADLPEIYRGANDGHGLMKDSRRPGPSYDSQSRSLSYCVVASAARVHGGLCASSPSSAVVHWSDWLREARCLGTWRVEAGLCPFLGASDHSHCWSRTLGDSEMAETRPARGRTPR